MSRVIVKMRRSKSRWCHTVSVGEAHPLVDDLAALVTLPRGLADENIRRTLRRRFPFSDRVRRKASGVVVDQLRASLAQPDSIGDVCALFGRQAWVVARPPWCRSRDVGRDAQVHSFRGVHLRATSRSAAIGIRTAVVNTCTEGTFRRFREVIPREGSRHQESLSRPN